MGTSRRDPRIAEISTVGWRGCQRADLRDGDIMVFPGIMPFDEYALLGYHPGPPGGPMPILRPSAFDGYILLGFSYAELNHEDDRPRNAVYRKFNVY
jgi:hypothetical protein